jgi:hypothetical protein
MTYGGENIIGSSFSFGDTNVLGVVFSVRRGLFLIFRIHMGSMIGIKRIVDLFIFSYKKIILQFVPKKLLAPKKLPAPFQGAIVRKSIIRIFLSLNMWKGVETSWANTPMSNEVDPIVHL